MPVDPNFVIDVWHDMWAEHDAIEDEAAAAAAYAAQDVGNDQALQVADALAADWAARRDALEMDAQRMLRVMAHLAPAIAASDASQLAAELMGLLSSFSATASTAAAMVKALVSLCAAKAPDEATASAICTQAAGNLLAAAEETLQAFAFHELPKSSSDGQQDPGGGCGRRQQRERQGQ